MRVDRRLPLALVLLIALGAMACGGTRIRELHTRFAFETGCPEDQITSTRLRRGTGPSGAQYGVSGCGHRAVYVYDYERGWLNNSSSEQAAQAEQ